MGIPLLSCDSFILSCDDIHGNSITSHAIATCEFSDFSCEDIHGNSITLMRQLHGNSITLIMSEGKPSAQIPSSVLTSLNGSALGEPFKPRRKRDAYAYRSLFGFQARAVVKDRGAEQRPRRRGLHRARPLERFTLGAGGREGSRRRTHVPIDFGWPFGGALRCQAALAAHSVQPLRPKPRSLIGPPAAPP